MAQSHKKFQKQLRGASALNLPRPLSPKSQPTNPDPPTQENPEIRPEIPAKPEPTPAPPPQAMSAPDPAAELSQSTGPQSTSAGVEELAAAISDIHVEEPAGAPGAPGAVSVDIVLNRDQFHDAFVMLHQFVGGSAEMLTGNKGYGFIAIQDREKPAARQASDALYRLAELYPGALGFLLQPGSEKFVCVVALGSYGLGKFVAVKRAVAHYAPKPAANAAPQADQKPVGTPQAPSA